MAIKVRIRIDAKCKSHPKYHPARDGKPRDCQGCDKIYVMWLYSKIVAKAALDDSVTGQSSIQVDPVEQQQQAEETDSPTQKKKEKTSADDNGESKPKDEAPPEPAKSSDAA